MVTATQRTCPKGHKYMKSSDCPTCPKCEAEHKPVAEFMAGLGAPARRALEAQGITTLHKLARWTKKDLLALHGFGPSAIPKLEQALEAEGLSLKEP
ncbi:MAG TPA: hypothetical protein VFH43_09395 [Candidatus Kapabacteria bacterium]|nr:hypothetical protein [Candidatus Kapabacteria bacterium]